MHTNSLKRVNTNENFINRLWCDEPTCCTTCEEKGHEIIGVIEPEHNESTPYAHFDHIADAQDKADIAIDFSNPNLLLPLLDEKFELPLVVATTGEKRNL